MGAAYVTSNLDFFDFVVCYGDPSPAAPKFNNASCAILPTLGGDLVSQIWQGGPEPTSPAAYASSLVVYAIFGFASAMFSAAAALLFLGLRCCSCVTGGSCGKRSPTFTAHSCRLGFSEITMGPAFPAASLHGQHKQPPRCCSRAARSLRCGRPADLPVSPADLAYPPRARLLVRVALLMYAAILVACVLVAQLSGNLALTTGMLVRGLWESA